MAGELTARPAPPPPADAFAPGVHPVEGDARRGLLRVPPRADGDGAAALLVLFHGAGGDAEQSVSLLAGLEGAADVVILAPRSHGPTWDFRVNDGGRDAASVDAALRWAFLHVPVDPRRIAAGGFSDGASFALSLGLANGDLFGHLLAFSPGFVAPAPPVGAPRIFVSHGNRDAVLPVERCGRPVVARLRAAGYDVEYAEFDGGHAVPRELVAQAMAWWRGSGG